jgi:hypothetical protein
MQCFTRKFNAFNALSTLSMLYQHPAHPLTRFPSKQTDTMWEGKMLAFVGKRWAAGNETFFAYRAAQCQLLSGGHKARLSP